MDSIEGQTRDKRAYRLDIPSTINRRRNIDRLILTFDHDDKFVDQSGQINVRARSEFRVKRTNKQQTDLQDQPEAGAVFPGPGVGVPPKIMQLFIQSC